MIAYAGCGTELRAGDILGSGTCGSGCLVELWGRNGGERVPPPLAVGDTVTMGWTPSETPSSPANPSIPYPQPAASLTSVQIALTQTTPIQ